MIAFDNLSRVPEWLSDALCRLATGGGFSTRELYTDAEEIIFDAQRPIILTGIDELATRGDLADRAIIISLPSIPEERRRQDADIRADFDAMRPAILGALLTAASGGLRRRKSVHLNRLPRMADFAVWVAATSPELGMKDSEFLDAYTGNRQAMNALPLEASLVAPFIIRLSEGGTFEGTATDLLQTIEGQATDETRKHRNWPLTGRALSGEIRRLAPNLRGVGVNIEFNRRTGKGRARNLVVHKISEGETLSASSASSADTQNQRLTADAKHQADANGHQADGRRTVGGRQSDANEKLVNARKITHTDGADGADAKNTSIPISPSMSASVGR